MINAASIIHPVQTHGDVIISAVASRDLSTAQSFAKKYDIPIAFGSYEELLDSPEVDFVYNALRKSNALMPSL
jgi:predicted dehydrogenase